MKERYEFKKQDILNDAYLHCAHSSRWISDQKTSYVEIESMYKTKGKNRVVGLIHFSVRLEQQVLKVDVRTAGKYKLCFVQQMLQKVLNSS